MKVLSQFESKGNIELLSQTTIAVFASKNAPEDLYLPASELFLALCKLPLSLCGGWQAPLEKKLLNLAYPEMTASILYYSARDISQVNQTGKLKILDMFGKLLLISAESRSSRTSRNDVDKRDALLFKQVDKVLFIYLEPAGRLEEYYNQLLKKNFPVFVLDHQHNKRFNGAGSIALNTENIDILLTS
jgi:hypothetical protein